MSGCRRTLLAVGVLVGLAVAGLAIVDTVLTPTPGVNQRNILRLRAGMTQSQVEKILGGVPLTTRWLPDYRGASTGAHLMQWQDNHGLPVVLWMYPDGLRQIDSFELPWHDVHAARLAPHHGSFIEAVLRWLGL